MNLKPLLFLAGAAGAAAAVMKRRGQSVQDLASAAPEPVRQAATTAAETVQRAVQNVTPGNGGDDQPKERYEPPIEAGAQQPATPGGPPTSDATVVGGEPVVSQPGGGLNEPEHPLPEGSVMPDVSDDDPLVRQQERAAAGDAGSIGGNINALASDDESIPRDQAERPVAEGSGDEDFENFEAREDTQRSNRELE
jgi:hypothetical protein